MSDKPIDQIIIDKRCAYLGNFETLRRGSPDNWRATPLRVLAVGEPCAGHWEGDVWDCRCSAKSPSECITETAAERRDDSRKPE